MIANSHLFFWSVSRTERAVWICQWWVFHTISWPKCIIQLTRENNILMMKIILSCRPHWQMHALVFVFFVQPLCISEQVKNKHHHHCQRASVWQSLILISYFHVGRWGLLTHWALWHTEPSEHPTLQTVKQTLHLIRTPLTVNDVSLWQLETVWPGEWLLIG